MIKIITAMTNDGVIGKDGKLPWHIPDDLKLFKKLTDGGIVVMGRKTYESLNMPHGLPNRINIVLTRNEEFVPHRGLYFINDLDLVLTCELDCFVIGGASVYKKLLPYADEMYISTIKKDYEGDTKFPKINWFDWKKVSTEPYPEFYFRKFVKKSCDGQ